MEYGIREADSGAVAISVRAAIDAYFDAESNVWVECGQDNYEASGDLWIVKKTGEPNANQVESLCQHAGWNGDLESVANGTWQTKSCSFVLNREEYKEQVRHRIKTFFPNGDPEQASNFAHNFAPNRPPREDPLTKSLMDRLSAGLNAMNVPMKEMPGGIPIPKDRDYSIYGSSLA